MEKKVENETEVRRLLREVDAAFTHAEAFLAETDFLVSTGQPQKPNLEPRVREKGTKDEEKFLAYRCRLWTADCIFRDVWATCCLCGADVAIEAKEAIELLHVTQKFEFICDPCAAPYHPTKGLHIV